MNSWLLWSCEFSLKGKNKNFNKEDQMWVNTVYITLVTITHSAILICSAIECIIEEINANPS